MLSANLTCINSDYISNLPILTPDNQTLLVAEVKTEQDTYISGRISLPQAILNAGINLTNTPADTWITTNSSNIGAATSWFLANNIRIGRATNWVLSNSTGVINAVTWLMNNSSDLSDNVNSSVNLEVTLADITVPTNVQHNLNTTTPLVQVLNAQGEQVGVKITIVDSNNLTILPLSSVQYFNAPVANGDIVSVTIAGGTVAYDAENTNITNFIVQNSATLIETANTVQSLTADEFLQNIITAWVDTNSGVITDAVNWIHILSAVREKHIDLEMAVFAWVTANSASLNLSNLVVQNLPAYTTWVEDNSSTLAYTYENIQSVPVETENATTWVLQNTANFEAVKTVLNDVFAGTSSNKTAIVEVSEQIKDLDAISKSTISSVEELQGEVKGIEDKIQPLQTSYKWWEDNNAVINSIVTWVENVSTTLISKAHLNAVEDLFKPIKTWVASNSAVLEDIATYIEHSDKTDSIISKQSSDIIDLTQKLSFVLEQINNPVPAVPVIIDNIKDNGWLIANKEDIIKSVEWYNKNSQYILNTLTNLNNPVVVKSDGTTEILVEGINKQIATLSETSTWVSGVSSLIAASLLNSDWLKNNKAAILDISNWVTNNSAQLIDNNTSISDIKALIADITIANADKVDVDNFKSALEQITTAVKTNSETLESHGKLLNNCLYAYQWVNSNKDIINTTIETVKSHEASIAELQNNVSDIVSNNNQALESISNEIRNIDERLTSETQKLSNYADIESWISANKNQLTNVREVVDKNSNSIAQINQTIESIALNVRFSDEKIKKTTNTVDTLQANLNKLDEAINWLTNNQDNNSTNDFEKTFSEKIIKIDECVKWFDDNKETIQDTLNIKIAEPLFKNWSLQNSENITNVIKWVEDNKNVKVVLQDNINSINQQLVNIVDKFEGNKNTVDGLSTWVTNNSSRLVLADKVDVLESAVRGLATLKTQIATITEVSLANKVNEQLLQDLDNKTLSSFDKITEDIKNLENKLQEIAVNATSTWVDNNSSALLRINAIDGWLHSNINKFATKEEVENEFNSYLKAKDLEVVLSENNNTLNTLTNNITNITTWVNANSGLFASSLIANQWIRETKTSLIEALKWIDENKENVQLSLEYKNTLSILENNIKSIDEQLLALKNSQGTIYNDIQIGLNENLSKLIGSVVRDDNNEKVEALDDSVNNLINSVAALEDRATKYVSDIDIIREKIQAASVLTNVNTLNINSNKNTIENALSDIDSLKSKVSLNTEAVEVVKKSLEDLQLSVLNRENSVSSGLLTSVYTEIAKLRNSITELSSTNINSVVENLQTENYQLSTDEDFISLRSSIEKIERDIQDNTEACVKLTGDISFIKELLNKYATKDWVLAQIPEVPSIEHVQKFVSELAEQISLLNIDSKEKDNALKLLDSEIKNVELLRAKVKEIESLSYLDRNLFATKTWVSTQIADLEGVKNAIDQYSQEFKAVYQTLETLRGDNSLSQRVDAEISAIKQTIADVSSGAALSRGEAYISLQGVRNDIIDIKEHIDVIKNQIHTLTTSSENVVYSNIESIDTSTFASKLDVESISSNLNGLEQRLAYLVIKVSTLKNEEQPVDLEPINASINLLKSQVNKVASDVSGIKIPEVDLTDVYSEIDHLNQSIENLTTVVNAPVDNDLTEVYSNIRNIEQRLAYVTVKLAGIDQIEQVDLTEVNSAIESITEQLKDVIERVDGIVIPRVDFTEINNEIVTVKYSISELVNKIDVLDNKTSDILDVKNQLTVLIAKVEEVNNITNNFEPLNSDISNIKAQIAALTIRITSLSQPTKVDLTGINDDISAVKENLFALEERINTSEKERSSVVNSEINTLKNQIVELNLKTRLLKPVEIDINNINSNFEKFNNSVEDLNEKINDITLQVNNIKPTEVDLSHINSEINTLKSVLAGLTIKVATFKPAEVDLTDINNIVNNVNLEVDTLKEQFSNITKSLSVESLTENDLDDVVTEVEKLKLSLAGLTIKVTSIKPIEFNPTELNNEIANIKNSISDLSNTVFTLSEDKDNFSTQVVEADFSGVNQEISSLKQLLAGLTIKVATLKPTEVDLSGITQEVEDVKHALTDLASKALTEGDVKEVDLTNVNDEINTLKQLLVGLTIKVATLKPTEVDLSGITQEVEDVKHALTDLASRALTEGDVKEVDLTNVNDEINTLKQLLAGLTIKIATLKPAEVDLSGVVKEIEQLKSSVHALNDTVGSDANDKEISNLKSLLVGYEQRLTLFAKSVSNYTKILQDDVFELKNKSETFADSNTLNDSLTNIADNYVKCSEKIESAESTINQLLANLKNIDTFNSNINAQVSTLATELNDIKILVENTLSEQANNNEFESYKIQVINFDNKISDLDNKLNAAVKLIGTLANKLETVSSPVLSVEENVVDKVCDCEEIVNQINNEVLTLKDLVEKYNTLSVSRVQFSKTVAELTAITDELKNDINNTLNSISFILEANQSQQEQIKQVQGSVDSVNAKLPIVHTTLNKHTEEISKILSRVTTNTQKIDEHTDILKWYIDSKDKLDALLLLPQNVQVESNDNTWFSANSALINNAVAESRNALIKVTNLSTWVTNNFNEVNNSINEIKETVREQVDVTTNLQEWLTANSRTLSEFAGTLEKYSNLSQNNNIWINSNEKQLLNSAKWVEDFSKLILTKIDNLQELTKNHKSVEDFIESNKEQILYWHNWLSDNADFVNKSTTWLQVLTSVKTQQTLKEIPLSITNEQADEAYNWVQSNSATYNQIANWYNIVRPELLLYSSWLSTNVSKIIETITWVNSNSGAFAVTQAQAFKTLMYSTSSSDWITYWGENLITRSNWVTGNSAAFANIKNSTEWFVNNQGKGTQALTWVLDNSSKISETARWVTLLSGARECHAALEREVFAWVMANSDITWVESWIVNNSACVYDACNWVRSKSAAFNQLSAYTDETSAAFLTAVNWVITNSAEIETNIDWIIANKTDLTTLCANYQPIFTDVISAVNWYKLSAERVSQAVEWVEDWSERTEWSVCWVEGWRDIVEDTVAWASSNSADYEAAYSWTKNNSAEFINHRVNIDYLLSATVSSINYFPYFKDALENLQTLSAAYLLDEGGNDCGPCTWPWEEPITRPVGALVDYHTNLRVLTGMTALEILSAILYGPQDIQFTLQPLTTAIRWDNSYTLTAAATSTSNTITYQWYRVSGSTNTLINGATLSSYQLDKSTYNKTDTRKYIVVATDTTTSKKATSTPANVFIVYHPTFTDQPDDTTASVGDSVTFSTTISNGFGGTVPPTYQWYRKGSGETEYALIAGATSSSYTRTVQGDDNNASFKVVVSGAGSFNNSNPSYQQQLYSTINELSTDESEAAIITLSYNFNFVTQPQTSAVRLGNTHTFFASATSDAGIVTYQWYNDVTGSIDGATSPSYSTNVSGRYGVSAFDQQNNAITSSTATLFTALTPVFTLQPNDASAPLNTEITLTSNATGTEIITYQWYRKNAGVLAYSKITGATSKDYKFTTSQTDDNATFIVVASGPDTWKPTPASLTYTMSGINDLLEVSSTAALIDIKNVPVITLQPTSSAIKTGNTHTFTASATSGDIPIVYQWYKGSITNTGFVILPNETTVTLSASSEGTYYLQASNANGIAQSSAAYLYITYPVGFTTTPQNTSVNVGSTATFTSTTTGTQIITYKWYKNSTLITNATSTSYTTSAAAVGDDNATFMVVASSPKTYLGGNGVTYQMTGINDLGSVSATAVLDVKMLPVITLQPSSSAIRIGNTHTFTASATSDTGSVTYQWYKGDINGANYILLNSQTSISLTADVSGTYRLVASNVNGSVSSNPGYLWTLTPVGFTTALTSPVSVNLNAPKTFTVVTSGSPIITYRWYKNSTLIPGATSTSYTISQAVSADDNATFMVVASSPKTYLGDNGVTYQMTGINDLGSVSSTSVFDVLFPPYIVTNPLTSAVKLGNSHTFVASATSETPFTYQWYKSPSTIITGQTNNTLTTSVSGTYFVKAVNVAGTTNSTSANLSTALVVGFTMLPVSVTAVAGTTVTYTSLASGTETSSGIITYQWYRKNTGDLTYTLITGATNRIYSFNATSTDDGDTFMVVASAPDSAWGYPMTGVNDLSTASATCTFTLSTPPQQSYILWGKFLRTNSNQGGVVPATNALLSSSYSGLSTANTYYTNVCSIPSLRFPLGKHTNGLIAVQDIAALAANLNGVTITFNTNGDDGNFNEIFYCDSNYFSAADVYPSVINFDYPDTTYVLDASTIGGNSIAGYTSFNIASANTGTPAQKTMVKYMSSQFAPMMRDACTFAFVPTSLPLPAGKSSIWDLYQVLSPDGSVSNTSVAFTYNQPGTITINVNGIPVVYYIWNFKSSIPNLTVRGLYQ